jgi:hypothetical protein
VVENGFERRKYKRTSVKKWLPQYRQSTEKERRQSRAFDSSSEI